MPDDPTPDDDARGPEDLPELLDPEAPTEDDDDAASDSDEAGTPMLHDPGSPGI
jgi:hypothetical protein